MALLWVLVAKNGLQMSQREGPQSERKNHHARLDSSVGVGQSGRLFRAGYSWLPPGDEVRTNRRERPCGRGCRRHHRLCGRVAVRPGNGCWIGERVPSRLLLLWFWMQPRLPTRVVMRSLGISSLNVKATFVLEGYQTNVSRSYQQEKRPPIGPPL